MDAQSYEVLGVFLAGPVFMAVLFLTHKYLDKNHRQYPNAGERK